MSRYSFFFILMVSLISNYKISFIFWYVMAYALWTCVLESLILIPHIHVFISGDEFESSQPSMKNSASTSDKVNRRKTRRRSKIMSKVNNKDSRATSMKLFQQFYC